MRIFENRRQFIKTVVASSVIIGTSGLVACSWDAKGEENAIEDRSVFLQSVMSGDPTPESVILWTRYNSTETQVQLKLEVSVDAQFKNLIATEMLTASADFDHCVKVRIVNLQPNTYYYYRFLHHRNGEILSSPVGRTKTAPTVDADQDIKFSYVSCQDYIGRYYNTYLKILEQDDLDFVVHLGDYIYETTGDASFQTISAERGITFKDLAGALHFKTPTSDFYAAQSLDNYRQLYRTYRSDSVLQSVQEKFPFIVTWDDHEYSDDCWQISGTYYNGAKNEANLQRKRNAEQAWFEYQPIDHEAAHAGTSVATQEALTIDSTLLYPNTRIFRDFQFGKNLHLFIADFRTYRPDHLIPEDAYPGTVVIDETTLRDYYTNKSDSFDNYSSHYAPYLNIDDTLYDGVRDILIAELSKQYSDALIALGFDAGSAQTEGASRATNVLKGNITVAAAQALMTAAQAGGLTNVTVANGFFAATGTGLAYSSLNKSGLFSEVGSRYFVTKLTFDVYADYNYRILNNTASQQAYSTTELNWLKDKIENSTAQNKILASSVSLAPFILDLTVPALSAFQSLIPTEFKVPFYLDCDQWDGFPNFKETLTKDILGTNAVLSISGDTHSTFVAEHPLATNGKRSVDFTGPAISSTTFSSFVKTTVQKDARLAALAALVPFIDVVVVQSSQDPANSVLKYSNTVSQGVTIATASSARFNVDFYTIPAGADSEQKYVLTKLYDQPQTLLDNLVKTTYFVEGGVLG